MSLAEIEAALDKLTSDELRCLAMKTWHAYLERASGTGIVNECSEEDSELLIALDDAIEKADATAGLGFPAEEVRSQLKRWTSK